MIHFENSYKTFSAGTLCLWPANFSVLSSEQKRPALISFFRVWVGLPSKGQFLGILFRMLVLAGVIFAGIKRNPE